MKEREKELIKLQGVSKILQNEYGVTLGDRNKIFDLVIEQYPYMDEKIGRESDLVVSKHFENAIYFLQCGKPFESFHDGELTPIGESQKEAVKMLLLEEAAPAEENDDEEKDEANVFLTSPVKKARVNENAAAVNEDVYMDTEWFPITSNICERLFSKCKLTIGFLRGALSPLNLELLLFLSVNKDLWELNTVAECMEKADAEEVVVEEEEDDD